MPAAPTVIIDTREQLPYCFSFAPVRVEKLDAGDYSLAGFESEIAIERKSLQDFIGSITSGRERFKRELERMAGHSVKCIIVESDMLTVSVGDYRGAAKPSSVLGTAASLFLDYNIPVMFCSNRAVANDHTERLLRVFAKRKGLVK